MFLLAFVIFSFQFVSANTLNNYVLESVGLNTTINLTFQITFDELIITSYSIEIYNLSYTHPSSCNSQLSSNSLFNYTTTNQLLTSTQAFSYIQCSSESEGGSGIKQFTSQIINNTVKWIADNNIGVKNTTTSQQPIVETTNKNIKIYVYLAITVFIIVVISTFFIIISDK